MFDKPHLTVGSCEFKDEPRIKFNDLAGMIIKTEEIRNNFYHGAIYKNRPDETCYEHAIDSEIRNCLEIFIRKYQKTETTMSFYGHDFSKSSDSGTRNDIIVKDSITPKYYMDF